MYNKALLALLAVVVIVLPSVDLIPVWNPTVTGKFLLFAAVMPLAGLCLLFYLFFQRKEAGITPADALLTGLGAYLLLNSYFHGGAGLSIRWFELPELLLLYFVLRWWGNDKV